MLCWIAIENEVLKEWIDAKTHDKKSWVDYYILKRKETIDKFQRLLPLSFTIGVEACKKTHVLNK